MADERKARPVSGEIMTAPEDMPQARSGHVAGDDIVDAEFEVVSIGAPSPEAEPQPAQTAIASPAAPLAGMDSLRRSEGPAAAVGPVRGGPIFWIVGIGLAAVAFWVSGGHALVRSIPFLAEQAPAHALSISGVTSRVDASGPRPVLFVEGEAANDGSSTEMLPPLDMLVTGNDGRVIRYRLGTSGRALAPGEKFAFSSRLDVPKNGVKTVSVTFGE